MSYTTIQHDVRLQLGLSLNDYCIADYIFRMAANPGSRTLGWCYASKRKIGEELGLSKTWVIKSITKLESDGILEKHPEDTRLLRTSQKWYDATQSTKDTTGEQTSPQSVNKVHRIGEQTSPPSENDSYNNILDEYKAGESESVFEKDENNTGLGGGAAEERAAKFRTEVWTIGGTTYSKAMLERFYDYWTELDRGRKPKMRFEKQKVFEIKKRLNIWATKNLDKIQCYLTTEQKTIAEKKLTFKQQLDPHLGRYGREMLNAFYQHWSQPENVANPTRLAWECEEFWDLANRLASWQSRNNKPKY